MKRKQLLQYANPLDEIGDFTKLIKGNQTRQLKVVIILRSHNSINDILKANVVDMSKTGIFTGKKRPMRLHTKEGIVFAFAPRSVYKGYIQDVA